MRALDDPPGNTSTARTDISSRTGIVVRAREFVVLELAPFDRVTRLSSTWIAIIVAWALGPAHALPFHTDVI